MIKFIQQKIKNQFWLTICLIIGISLLVASFSCRPMFMTGSLNWLLQKYFTGYIEENNQYPTAIGKNIEYVDTVSPRVDTIQNVIDKNQEIWAKYLNETEIISSQTKFETKMLVARSDFINRGTTFSVYYMPEMENHIQIVNQLNESELVQDCYPCMISEKTMDARELVIGEQIEFTQLVDKNGNPPKLIVAGVYSEKEEEDLFWYMLPNENDRELYVTEDVFDHLVQDYQVKNVTIKNVTLLDYEKIKSEDTDSMITSLKQFEKNDPEFFYTFQPILKQFINERQMIDVMLWVLELPILGMVLAFIYMISNQIVEAERGEIATLKSRGISRFQVIRIYILRLTILASFACALGIPLGYGFCKMAASTTDFLTFSGKNVEIYHFVPEMIVYGLVAAGLGIIFILFPVIKYSKISIVEYKSSYSQGKKSFIEKYYIDVALLVVSLYLLYSSSKSIDELRITALNGNRMDPMIFLNTCLFIIAAGLVAFRLMHLFVKLIYTSRKKKWKSVSYVSFLQITRTYKKQTFISVFMIMTVALGLFNANAARTINRNNVDRIEYSTGADVRIQEKWSIHQFSALSFRYIEPDYSKYEGLIEDGICDSIAKVMIFPKTNVETSKLTVNDCMVMGIDTKQFGLTADLKEELYEGRHWFYSLDSLAVVSNGAIISRNLADALHVGIGDMLTLDAMKIVGLTDPYNDMGVCVTDIVDAWPGYSQYYYEKGEQRERYLMVVNISAMLRSFAIRPYQIWTNLADGVTDEDLRTYLDEKEIVLSSFESIDQQVSAMKESPKIQITNGMFTLSFLISIGLCGVGFLIYWITSIGQRELLFGVYRAMGLSVRNLNRMLIYEHFFSTFLSVLSGGTVGMVATLLFIRLFGVVYLPEKSNLGIYIYYEMSDMIKLFVVIALVIVLCLVILRKLIQKMNITQALKLGED